MKHVVIVTLLLAGGWIFGGFGWILLSIVGGLLVMFYILSHGN